MNPDLWNVRFLSSSRGKIVALLRAGGRTVNELAQELGLTDNAVRSHLATLERDGLISQQGVRRGFRKPEFVYELTPSANQFFPKAHELLLTELVSVLKERETHEAVEALLETVGRRIAASYTAGLDSAGLEVRTDTALQALSDIGGMAKVTGNIIRGASCPLASLTTQHPEVCRLAAALIAEILGRPVTEQCERGDRPRCCFAVAEAG